MTGPEQLIAMRYQQLCLIRELEGDDHPAVRRAEAELDLAFDAYAPERAARLERLTQ